MRGVVFLQAAANGLGILVVALYFAYLFPPGEERELAAPEINVPVFVGYLVFMLLLALPLNALLLRRAVSWVREGRPPTDAQRRLVFSLPLLETASALVAWAVAAVIFGVVNSGVARVSVGIMLAGVVTCTLLYLLLEGHFRPVFALALAGADLPADRRDVMPRLMLSWMLGSAVPLAAIGLSPLISPEQLDGHRLTWLTLVGILAGGAVMAVAAVSVARPLNRVRDALRLIEQGDSEVYIPVDDLGEIGRLAEGVNDLAAGLRERQALRDLFDRQVGQEGLADLAMADGGPGPGSGDRREVTVLFVDLRGYTRYAEQHSPEEVVAMLNRFIRVVVAVVNREGGWINKLEGDAALCLFGAPQDQPDHALRALRAAAAMPAELARLEDMLECGIGVASGEVVAGFVGTRERFEYTVIGDVVNLAARLCEEAKGKKVPVLADSTTFAGAGSPEEWRADGRIGIRGRKERAEVFTYGADRERSRRSRRKGIPWPSNAERNAP